MEGRVKRGKSVGIFDRFLEIGCVAAMGMILFLMLGVCARVGIRYIFGFPINWVIDVSTIFQVYLTFLAAAWLLREEGHVSIDVVFSYLKPRHQFLLQSINSVLCAMVCALISVYGVAATWSSWKLDLRASMPLEPPQWTLLAMIPLGSILLFLQFLRRTQRFMQKYRSCNITKKDE
jgi:C4-dicarboxylate transporter DctQ subunit